jgi:hypothetical protein
MMDKKPKKNDIPRPRKDYFLSLVKSVKKKIKQKVLRRKRFLRVL